MYRGISLYIYINNMRTLIMFQEWEDNVGKILIIINIKVML